MKLNLMNGVAVLALGALIAYPAATARAENLTAEIRALKAKLRQLEEKVARQEHQVRGIAKSPKMPPAAETPVVCKDAPCPPPPPPVFVSLGAMPAGAGLKVESWDDAFSFRIGGRMVLDGGSTAIPYSPSLASLQHRL